MLLFKVLCTPILIWLSVLIGRRWGAFVGGCFAGLPTISGPLSLCIAIEQGPDFAAAVAYNALLGVGAVCLFTLAYAWTSLRQSWFVALLVAEVVFFSAGWAMGHLPRMVPLALLIGMGGAPAVLLCMPKLKADMAPPKHHHHPWVVPLQMFLGGALVYAISEAAPRLGVHWSGILTFYPVMISILAPFCHAEIGPYASTRLLAGLMTGFIGGTSFTVVVLFGVQNMPLALCYTLAALASIGICAVVAWWEERHLQKESK